MSQHPTCRLPSLTIVIGLPGSGKSTLLTELKTQNPDLVVFDDVIQTWYTGQAKKAIHHGSTPVVLADPRLCNVTVLENFLKEAQPTTTPVIVFLDVDPMTCLERIRQRDDGRRGVEKSMWSLAHVLPSTLPGDWISPVVYRQRYM